MFKTTSRHKKFWSERKINWESHYFNPDHPHRDLIVEALRRMRFRSVYEIGCGAGANLYRVIKAFPGTRVGGIDVNKDAIEEARKHLPFNAVLEARSAEDIFMNAKSLDVLLSDACLIYVGPLRIHKVMGEIRRVVRNNVVFVELHSDSFIERMKIRWRGYHAYDYRKLLRSHGFYDIEIHKIPKGVWDGTPWEHNGCVVTAKI